MDSEYDLQLIWELIERRWLPIWQTSFSLLSNLQSTSYINGWRLLNPHCERVKLKVLGVFSDSRVCVVAKINRERSVSGRYFYVHNGRFLGRIFLTLFWIYNYLCSVKKKSRIWGNQTRKSEVFIWQCSFWVWWPKLPSQTSKFIHLNVRLT